MRMAYSLFRLCTSESFFNYKCTRILATARNARLCSSIASPQVSAKQNTVFSKYQDCLEPKVSVTQRFFERSTGWPEKTAIQCGVTGRSYSYNQLVTLSKNFGGSLLKMGFNKGDVIGLVLPNIPEFPIAFFGAAGIGMAVTTVNPTYTPEEIARQLQNCATSVVVTFPAMINLMRKVSNLYPNLKRVIIIGDSEEEFTSFRDLLRDNGELFPANLDVNLQEDTLLLPYSSGTTGVPKGVVLTNYNITTNVQQLLHPGSTKLQETSESFQETYICVLPFFHIYGIVALMNAGFDHGAKLVTLPRFETESFLTAIHEHEPTQLYLVPPLVNLLASHPGLKMNSLQRLHTVSSGAAPLSQAISQKFQTKFSHMNVTLQEGYGLTETSGPTHLCPLGNSKVGSVGELLSRTQAKIVDLQTGEALGQGEKGELCIRGPQIMKGYNKNPDATKAALDSSGWLHTGDIAYYDEDKQFFIAGRLKELIKVKGFQVSPSELEDVLCYHGGVADAAVVGVPDEFDGEVPCAFVVQKSSSSGSQVSKNEIIEFIENRVAPHKRLKGGVIFVDSIPKSPTGKILRNQLKEMAGKRG